MIDSGTRTMEDYYVTNMYINVEATNIRQQCRSHYRGILFTTLKNLKHLLFCHLAERHTVRILPSLLLIMIWQFKSRFITRELTHNYHAVSFIFQFHLFINVFKSLKKKSVLKILKKSYSRVNQYYARS